MEYGVKALSKLAGVSARTLRYYDQLGLLKPARIGDNGYRIYGQKDVDLLQQILFFRELGMPLEDIRKMIFSRDFDRGAALRLHLTALRAKRDRLDQLIANVEKTISADKGEIVMSDWEKFEGFKQRLLDKNEQKYGGEIRANYGGSVVEASNEKFMNMTREQYAQMERLGTELAETLKAAFLQGDPSGELAQRACAMHKEWLCFFWTDYSQKAHKGVAQMYVDDPRFKEYYDRIAPGCAEFLRDAVMIYCE